VYSLRGAQLLQIAGSTDKAKVPSRFKALKCTCSMVAIVIEAYQLVHRKTSCGSPRDLVVCAEG
jgi:hypothetical protein